MRRGGALGHRVVEPEHHEATVAEQRVQGVGEGIGEGRLRPIGGRQPGEDGTLEFAVGRAGSQLLEGRRHGVPAQLPPQRQLRRLGGALAQEDSRRFPAAVQEPRVVRFGEVVVVAGDPEHRNDRHAALLLEPAGQRDRGEGLVDRVERAREQTGLLARGDAQDLARGEAVAARSRQARGDDFVRHAPGCPGRGGGRRWTRQRRSHDPRDHGRSPTRIARAESAVRGRPS